MAADRGTPSALSEKRRGHRPLKLATVPATRSRYLTGRDSEVWRLLAKGLSNAEIAGVLVIGETTVKSHSFRLLMKLGATSRTQAVVMAYETGLVRPGNPTDGE